MDFDSHIGGIVLLTAELVNVLTPGESGGRPYSPPTGSEAAAWLEEAFARARWMGRGRLSKAELAGFADAARRLRTVFDAVAGDELDSAASTVNSLMDRWHAHPKLARHDGEPWHLHFHAVDAGFVEGWAAGMATSLAFVLGSEYADRLGVCSAPACDRVYADTSRNGTKRFCSTACQNRVKASAFRARRAGRG